MKTCPSPVRRPVGPGGTRCISFCLPLWAAGLLCLAIPTGLMQAQSPAYPFDTRELPPPEGLWVGPAGVLDFGFGQLVRNLRLHSFNRTMQPPPLGATAWHSCRGRLEMEVSRDNGLTWEEAAGDAYSAVRVTHDSDTGGVETYSLAGGDSALDCLVTWRDGECVLRLQTCSSPLSTGTMHIEEVAGRHQIDSFFDIYFVGVQPTGSSCRLELCADRRPEMPVAGPSRLLPTPADEYAMPAGREITFPGGIAIRDVRHKVFGSAALPPAPGAPPQYQTFGSIVEMDVSTGGSPSFLHCCAPALTETTVRRLTAGSRELYENEMTGLTVSGGDLPVWVMVRESPTLPSRGLTSIVANGQGYDVSSFFDIFLDVSIDGGLSWNAATNGAALVQSREVGPHTFYATELLPPPDGAYRCAGTEAAVYPVSASPIVLRNVTVQGFSASIPPPPGGSGDVYYTAVAALEVSLDGGATFKPCKADAFCHEQITSSQDAGAARYFDTEMVEWTLQGGTLPLGIQIRESPTRASSGRASWCETISGGPWMVDSFFDIFTEVSLDGGMSWTPSNCGPLTIALQPASPPALTLTPPPDFGVFATCSSGAEITYNVVVSGGVPPYSLICSPPSGSMFPVGETTVYCSVTDSVGQQASGSSTVVVDPYEPPARYFDQKLMPPPNGLYLAPDPHPLVLPNGVALRNVRLGQFESCATPPPLGNSLSHSCGAALELEVSTDGGETWQAAAAPAGTTQFISHDTDVFGEEEYSIEETQLNATGGSLPPGMMIRESPTRASSGATRITDGPTGHMISSFFDIYIEVSTDGGATWTPAPDPLEMRLVPDPAVVPPDETLSLLMPPPDDRLASTSDPAIVAPTGIQIRKLELRSFAGCVPPPVPGGGGQTTTLTGWGDCDFSTDGGATWQAARDISFSGSMFVERWGCGEVGYYDTEMVSLQLAGGGLPSYLLIRESPTIPSRGMTRATGGGGGGGGGVVQSFFDIYIEVSTDGGMSWNAATSAPTHMETEPIALPDWFTDASLVPAGGMYVSEPNAVVEFPMGIAIRNLRERSFTSVPPLPDPGAGLDNDCDGWMDMELSFDGGLTYETCYAKMAMTLSATATTISGSTSYYDTEITKLDISGGNLPPFIMIRESPTRASTARGVARDDGGGIYGIDSFFDIYIEVSTDGGISWLPADNGPVLLLLEPLLLTPLALTCPADITVRATDPAGMVVDYPPPTTSGGFSPCDIVCNPPAGSVFPVGVTRVDCLATDLYGQTAPGSFQITVLRPLKKHFYREELYPPATGEFMGSQDSVLAYPNGVLVRNLACGRFSSGVVPPPPGESLTHAFVSDVELEVSWDGGLSWETHTAQGIIEIRLENLGPDGADTLYGLEVLQLDIGGGTLPPGIQIRESPVMASLGETRIEAVAGGYQIDSFFDIFTELSTDGGSSWWPSSQPLQLELYPDPASAPAVALPRTLFPAPNGQYVQPQGGQLVFPGGILIRDLRNKLFTMWVEPPSAGGTLTHTFDAQLDFDVSYDGGTSWSVARAPGTMTVELTNVREVGTENTYDLVVTQLDMAGGDLPAFVRLRESPVNTSQGGMVTTEGGGGGSGGCTVSSFFDIFTEISLDGGASWGPATSGPVHLELARVDEACGFPADLMPPPTGREVSAASSTAEYPMGIVVRKVVHRSFTASIAPPPPGTSTSHTFGSSVDMELSLDGGTTFEPKQAPATVTMQITARLGGDGLTEYYDIERTQFDIAGGDLPSYLRIRESPTRASLGRTTQTLVGGGYDIDSFFDIWTEISIDGGMSWYAATNGPLPMLLAPAPTPPLEITAPPDMWVLADAPGGTVVTYPAPVVTGGLPPITVTCIPPSGSLFPQGTTTVLCTAKDSAGQEVSDSFTVTVLPYASPPEGYFTANELPPRGGMHVSSQMTTASYPTGVMIRDLRSFQFSASFPPPLPGLSQINSWDSLVELELSPDGGLTWIPMPGTATSTARVTGELFGGGIYRYKTEMLAFDVALPAGILIRESPTLPSLGRATSRAVMGGFLISSFFDIYTEISIDGGVTWMPCLDPPAVLESRQDDGAVPRIATPSALLPPPGDLLVQRSDWFVSTASGTILTDARLSLPTPSQLPPAPGVVQFLPLTGWIDCRYSMDGGMTFHQGRSGVEGTIRTVQLGSAASPRYDTELVSLTISGGDLPGLTMVRESPVEPSPGGTVERSRPDGTYGVASFFDVFLEVSTDGGATWMPSVIAPARLELADADAEEEYPLPVLPPPEGLYAASPAGQTIAYANGIVVRSLVHRQFTQATPPPPPGGQMQIQSYGSVVDLLLSMDGGATFRCCTAPAQATQTVTPLVDQGATRYFDTEMLQLDIAGGTLPANIRIRESPTRPSLGRTSERATPIDTWFIDSFFDVFTEVSTDGGMTWWPATSGPLTLALRLPTASESWRMRYFNTTLNACSAADLADPDHDGSCNIIEFATHSNPTQSTPPPAQADTSSGHLVLTWTRDKAAMADVEVTVEYSLELWSWIPCDVGVPVYEDEEVQTMQTTIPDVPGGRCFARLRVTRW